MASSRQILNIVTFFFVFALIMAGVYYSITLTGDFNEKSLNDKVLAVTVTVSTIVSGILFTYNFLIPLAISGFKTQ